MRVIKKPHYNEFCKDCLPDAIRGRRAGRGKCPECEEVKVLYKVDTPVPHEYRDLVEK